MSQRLPLSYLSSSCLLSPPAISLCAPPYTYGRVCAAYAHAWMPRDPPLPHVLPKGEALAALLPSEEERTWREAGAL
eukprot:1069281-Rhodomonas_salina.1